MKIIFIGLLLVSFCLPLTLHAKDPSLIESKDIKIKDELRKELWKEFNKIRFEKFGKFQKINIYAENNSLTRICFICDKGLFVYYHKDFNNDSLSHIERVVQPKFMDYDMINRITFEKEKDFGFFKLWYYETEELSIGGGWD